MFFFKYFGAIASLTWISFIFRGLLVPPVSIYFTLVSYIACRCRRTIIYIPYTIWAIFRLHLRRRHVWWLHCDRGVRRREGMIDSLHEGPRRSSLGPYSTTESICTDSIDIKCPSIRMTLLQESRAEARYGHRRKARHVIHLTITTDLLACCTRKY